MFTFVIAIYLFLTYVHFPTVFLFYFDPDTCTEIPMSVYLIVPLQMENKSILLYSKTFFFVSISSTLLKTIKKVNPAPEAKCHNTYYLDYIFPHVPKEIFFHRSS